MQKLKWTVAGILALVIALYAGVGFVVMSRNRVPSIQVPPRAALPAGNVYNEYLRCVQETKLRDKVLALTQTAAPSASIRQAVVEENAELVRRLRSLAGKPSMVTELEQGANFVASVDFPYTSRLAVLNAQELVPKNPGAALETLLDALDFTEGVMRGGAILHLDTAYHASLPIFQWFPNVLPNLSAADARKGADRLKALIQSQGSLAEIFQNERRVRNRIVTSLYKPDAMRGFRPGFLWAPEYERDYLLKPKGPTVQGLDYYLKSWVEQANRPYAQFQPPKEVQDPEKLLNDETLSPGAFTSHYIRYHWRSARLRLLYAALRLEHIRKDTGRYPAALPSDPFFVDPFSANPLLYRPQGNRYLLYSVGMNGADDGGEEMSERSLRPDQSGDLLLHMRVEN